MKLGAVLMAAGAGRRFGGNKLLYPVEGVPLIDRAMAALPPKKTCPHCGQGPVHRAVVRRTGEAICLCEECDTVWTAAGETNLTAFLEERGLTPSWEELDLLAVMDESDTL